jgi:hypothetical protein
MIDDVWGWEKNGYVDSGGKKVKNRFLRETSSYDRRGGRLRQI